jgi:hypothetical protein
MFTEDDGGAEPHDTMTKEDDYRINAARTIELASRSGSSADKGHLLSLAEKWLDLADRAHRLTKRIGAKHRGLPLVDRKLGIGPSDVD